MICKNIEKLKDNLIRKGITFKTSSTIFDRNDYFQVINGYKALFVDSIESIDEIVNNVNLERKADIERYMTSFNIDFYPISNEDKEKFLNEILKYIGEKYGLQYSGSSSFNDKISKIKEIGYIHHIYKGNTYYEDFLRMYHFEHELRNCLMKYILIIEDNIKRIFIFVLNELQCPPDFLENVNNYNSNTSNSENITKTIDKIIELSRNDKSKPIKRKIEQNLVVPYWILINEMTMGQTLSTIKNLKPSIKNKILEKGINEFTNKTINIENWNNCSSNAKSHEKTLLYAFAEILTYIGDFRNLLAHNQPIYCFNVKDSNLSNFPNFYYDYPRDYIKKNERNLREGREELTSQQILSHQYRHNQDIMKIIKEFYGEDDYNRRNHKINIDLSWIIYITGKIYSKIENDNISYKTHIKYIYRKYNIFSIEKSKLENKLENLDTLIKKINDEVDESTLEYINSINNEFKSLNSNFKNYDLFPCFKRYQSFTYINKTFILNL